MEFVSKLVSYNYRLEDYKEVHIYDPNDLENTLYIPEKFNTGDPINIETINLILKEVKKNNNFLSKITHLVFYGLGWGSRFVFENKRKKYLITETIAELKLLDYLNMKYLTDEEEKYKTYENLSKLLSTGFAFFLYAYLKN